MKDIKIFKLSPAIRFIPRTRPIIGSTLLLGFAPIINEENNLGVILDVIPEIIDATRESIILGNDHIDKGNMKIRYPPLSRNTIVIQSIRAEDLQTPHGVEITIRKS